MRGWTRAGSAVLAAAAAATALGLAAPAAMADTRPGARCTQAGIVVHAGGVDLRCMKRGAAQVWVAVGSSVRGSSDTAGLASSASIPKVIRNWGLVLEPYSPATGMAGVMAIRGVVPPTFANAADTEMYRRIVDLYGQVGRGQRSPQLSLWAPLGTPVIAMADGTVCDLPKLYSGDFSVRIAPKGIPCQGNAATVLLEHEHLISPLVRVGQSVRAGQRIGTVSDANPHWQARGLGLIEIGVFYVRKGGTGSPLHACPANAIDPSLAPAMLAALASIQTAWMAELGDPTLYDLATQHPVGCVTAADVADGQAAQQFAGTRFDQ